MAMLGGECSACCGGGGGGGGGGGCCQPSAWSPEGRQSVGYQIATRILNNEFSQGDTYTGATFSGSYNNNDFPVYGGLNPVFFGDPDTGWFSVGATTADGDPWPSTYSCPVLGTSDIWVPVASVSSSYTGTTFAYVAVRLSRYGISVSPALVVRGYLSYSFTKLKSVTFGGVTLTQTSTDLQDFLFSPESTCDLGEENNARLILHPNDGGPVYSYSRNAAPIKNIDFKGPLSFEYEVVDYDNPAGSGFSAPIESGSQTIDWPELFEIQDCPSCSGACCETDGSCSIKVRRECDTEDGAVFAGVGETCVACSDCSLIGTRSAQMATADGLANRLWENAFRWETGGFDTNDPDAVGTQARNNTSAIFVGKDLSYVQFWGGPPQLGDYKWSFYAGTAPWDGTTWAEKYISINIDWFCYRDKARPASLYVAYTLYNGAATGEVQHNGVELPDKTAISANTFQHRIIDATAYVGSPLVLEVIGDGIKRGTATFYPWIMPGGNPPWIMPGGNPLP